MEARTLLAHLGGWIRPQDVVWLLLFSALAAVSGRQSAAELEMLGALALLQVLAPRVSAFDSPAGHKTVLALKLLVGFLLIGVTGGIASAYYPVLLLPVVSAATTLGAAGAAFFILFACLAYLAFLPVAQVVGFELTGYMVQDVSVRVVFLPVVGYLTYQLAQANRAEARRAQAAADQLAQANLSLRDAEAAVRRSDRLAALGQLTAGLAHELRNPLGTIRASADLLAQKLNPGEPLHGELAGYISSEVDRANALITRFLEFARPLELRRSAVDLNELADRAIGQAERQGTGGVSVHRNYAPDIPPIAADAELLERVLFNLVQNALQASPVGGAVTVKTRPLAAGVELAVIDRGAGIAEGIKEQIFNPFFTTKPGGVGLGLAIVSKIVDEHRGRLSVESEPGKGSIFLIQLPLGPETDSSSM